MSIRTRTENMRAWLTFWLIIAATGAALVAVTVSGFYIACWINWKFGYETLVEKKVTSMVKAEALR